MTRPLVAVAMGAVTGVILAAGFGVVATTVELHTDQVMGWVFVFLPLSLGVVPTVVAILTRRDDSAGEFRKATVGAVGFILAAAIGYFIVEAALISELGGDRTMRTVPRGGIDWGLAAWVGLGACSASGVISLLTYLTKARSTDVHAGRS